MKKFVNWIFIFCGIIFFNSCSSEPEEVQNYGTSSNSDSQDVSKDYMREKAAGDAFLAKNKTRVGVNTTSSGLQYEVIKEGNGAKPTLENIVKVHYTGYLINGEKFESSLDQGKPVEFQLNRVIKGWTEGLQLMTLGSKYKFYIPTELAYDKQENQKIKSGSTLIFEVELLEIIESEKSRSNNFLAENKKKPSVKVTNTGLQYEIVKQGNGNKPTASNMVKVHYTGTLIDGTKFDSSVDRGQPAEFRLNQVIAGWTEGLQLMNTGSKFRFYIPSELAYGDNPPPGSPIQPGSALIFSVELLEIKK
jgi:FKBP-type peptidyl-prolyl cis-trans isomerase